ncbi:TonB C-terminal domain-containing protein [Novosphingobium gossypii]|uniref:TonB C-terminal domain-containing protein n=1 Tax=Novosphingobium gossypii TaxID=1604774 RepID=UPI003D1CF4CE
MPARFGAFLLALALSFAASTVASGRAAERAYDIPAQDLEKALLAFGRISGIDIVYEPAILKGMRSEPLRGRFSPPFAVATLLHGSGLAHRFTSATAVLILRGGTHVPDEGEPSTRLVSGGRPQLALGRLKVTAARVIGQPQTDYRPFGHVVQNTIMRRLQDHPATHNRRFEARLSVRIDAHGVIRTLHLASGSGNAALDGEVLRALDGMQLPAVPPPAMPQPVWFEIVQR